MTTKDDTDVNLHTLESFDKVTMSTTTHQDMWKNVWLSSIQVKMWFEFWWAVTQGPYGRVAYVDPPDKV